MRHLTLVASLLLCTAACAVPVDTASSDAAQVTPPQDPPPPPATRTITGTFAQQDGDMTVSFGPDDEVTVWTGHVTRRGTYFSYAVNNAASLTTSLFTVRGYPFFSKSYFVEFSQLASDGSVTEFELYNVLAIDNSRADRIGTFTLQTPASN